jgi:hypothetical protein
MKRKKRRKRKIKKNKINKKVVVNNLNHNPNKIINNNRVYSKEMKINK